MEWLPGNVLLEVMKNVDVADLLTLRLVSRRLGGLALQPDAWRHRCVYFSDRSAGCQSPVLRLAPCLRKLQLSVPLPRCHQLFTTTKCAVSDLSIVMGCGGRKRRNVAASSGVLVAALVIRNQEALGRMRSLGVYGPNAKINDAAVLMGTVASTSGLETLGVHGGFPDAPLIMTGVHRSSPRSSLKEFSCFLDSTSEAFCNLMLATHAATLEDVDIVGIGKDTLAMAVPLLAAMPNLRKLECCPAVGLEALAACKSLTDLELSIDETAVAEERVAAVELLRRAEQLRIVSLSFFDTEECAPGASRADLILALASDNHRHLESLTIGDEDGEDFFGARESILEALPFLRALRHLDVPYVPNDFLLGFTPDTVPALRTLRLESESGCVHHFRARDAVQSVLSLNPLLELSLRLSSGECVPIPR